MSQERVPYVCECGSEACRLTVSVLVEEAPPFRRDGCILIIDGCANGPAPGDTLVAQKQGYAWYKEAEQHSSTA
jgi:hypothetical protein